jgi:sugar-specific transcriptional regulator TrmB
MVLREDLLSRLRKIFGLNLYEVKIWVALLSRGVSTAGELSNISGVPRSRTYDILESLERKGFVVMKLGKPIKFIALKPNEVVERAKKNFIEEAKEKGKVLDEIKESELMKQLIEVYTKGLRYVEPHELSGVLKGKYNIANHIESLVSKAQKEVMIFTTEKGLERKIEVLKPTLEKLKKRGVKIKIATQITKNNIELAKEISNLAEIRHTNINARIVVIDGKAIVFMLFDDKAIHPQYDLGVWINSEYFVSAIRRMMEESWNSATPLNKVKVG